jgi:uncharacterized protein YjeT (DUF2065 family)
MSRCFWVSVGAGCASWKVVLVLGALLRGFVPGDARSLVSEVATDLASSLTRSGVSVRNLTAGSVILLGGSSESGLGRTWTRGDGVL